jgi:pre-rRNA-processing protein TSR3
VSVPPTLLVVHPRENRRKCSLEPLRGRCDLRFVVFPPSAPVDGERYVRLTVDGPPLSADDADRGLLLLDGNWWRAESMNRPFLHVPSRSLRGFKTAYPRSSKRRDDPSDGLASIEALYVAYRLVGRPTDGLLDGYRWRDVFLAANGFESQSAVAATPAQTGRSS